MARLHSNYTTYREKPVNFGSELESFDIIGNTLRNPQGTEQKEAVYVIDLNNRI